MNWTDIIISLVSIIVTGLTTWIVSVLTNWLNTKIKGLKSERYIQEALDIIKQCVKATYQTYVEALKGTDAWTTEAQEKALNMALDAAKESLSTETKEYITNTYGDLNNYLVGLIESVLYDLKN